jgi:2-methylcitrate dehydratase PrpD
MDATARISRFVAETKYENIPSSALQTAKTAVLDCLGVALAGSKEETANICARIARQEATKEETTVIGQGFRSSSLHAAFANGTAAHALDFDHSFTMMGQPTAPIIPAVISLGESLGASGREILEAYVVGFEVTAKLVYALRATAQDGWHGPGTLGSFGAAAACAKLLKLDPSQIEMALGITASMAGGVVCNFGTMTKPLHVGLGARNGVLAAKLAQSGFTANAAAIEARNGLFDVFYHVTPSGNGPVDELGKSFALITDGIRIKPYPCGGLTHQAIDAVLDFRAKHGITADMVESIGVDVMQHTYNRIAFRIPQTGIQGKFCMGYLLARAIIDGRVSLDAFTDSAVKDPNVLKLAEKVQMRLDNKLRAQNDGSRPCRVTISLKNGQTYCREAQHAKGSPEVPMTPDELEAKFTECARQAISGGSAQQVMEYVERLETLKDIRPLCELLMGEK